MAADQRSAVSAAGACDRCDDVPVDLSLLHEIAAERRARWEAVDVAWEVVDGPLTDKPAAWLILSGTIATGQLTVWVSGEAEMDWGTPDGGGERHYDLDSREALNACVGDLEGALGLT